jgi:uncharacterized protein (DUF1800 family)
MRTMSGQPGENVVKSKAKPALGINPSMGAISADKFGYDEARHLLWRAGFGGTSRQIQTLAGWGPEKAVDYLLNYESAPTTAVEADAFDRNIMRPPTDEERRMQAEARRSRDEEKLEMLQRERQMRERRDRSQMNEVQKWWLKRMIETGRPLEEKLTLFWHGHFATSYRTIENSYHMFLQNQMFRKNAAGNFADLLFGIIRDPAMIAYLDNNDSRKGRANENLAREIMELFSLGIGNYSEQDIKEGARALTGYTFNDDEFVFQKNNHDGNSKRILGRNGDFDGDDFVKIILEQPACARFITRKMYHFFVKELPPLERAEDHRLDSGVKGALADLSSVFLRSKYEIKPMLRRMFLSEHFYSPAFMNEQIKSPVSLVVGAVRSLDAPVRDLSILNDAMDLMGQNLGYPPSVKGWDGGRSWINTSTLYVRQNIMAFLLTGKRPNGYDPSAETETFDAGALLSELQKADPAGARDPERVVDYLLKLTVGRTPMHTREPLLAFLKEHGNQLGADHLRGLLLLITAMPEYQLC